MIDKAKKKNPKNEALELELLLYSLLKFAEKQTRVDFGCTQGAPRKRYVA